MENKEPDDDLFDRLNVRNRQPTESLFSRDIGAFQFTFPRLFFLTWSLCPPPQTSVLNKHLQELMDGLTAKVFRTYNASITLQQQLKELTSGASP